MNKISIEDQIEETVELLKLLFREEARQIALEDLCGEFHDEWDLKSMKRSFKTLVEKLGSKSSARLFVLYLFAYLVVTKQIKINFDDDTKKGRITSDRGFVEGNWFSYGKFNVDVVERKGEG